MRFAVVLGGGRSARMGTDKLKLELEGRTLLARTCDAAARFAQRIVVVGPEQDGLEVDFLVEDPPFGGPAAGIAAGIHAFHGGSGSDELLILAGDLKEPHRVIEQLADAVRGPDGVVLVDHDGWPQYLAGRYRLGAVRGAVAALSTVRDVSVRRLLGGLQLAQVPSADTDDVDTPAQARSAGITLRYDDT